MNIMPIDDQIVPTDTEAIPLRLVAPVHDVVAGEAAKAAALIKRRGPGRPRKVEVRPTIDDLDYHAVIIAERHRFIAADPLVQAIERRANTRTVLAIVMQQMAEEAGSLGFESIEIQKRGRDAAQTSSRRVDALRKVAEIQVQLRELDGETLNTASEQFQRIFALWVERLSDVLQVVLEPHEVDLVMSRLAAAMANWEQEASHVM
jgi:hypothetical protein